MQKISMFCEVNGNVRTYMHIQQCKSAQTKEWKYDGSNMIAQQEEQTYCECVYLCTCIIYTYITHALHMSLTASVLKCVCA